MSEPNLITVSGDATDPRVAWSLGGEHGSISAGGGDPAIPASPALPPSPAGSAPSELPAPPAGPAIEEMAAGLESGVLTCSWPAGAGDVRIAALLCEDGTAIVFGALQGGGAHGENPTAGWRIGPEGAEPIAAPFDEALISTEYGPDGVQRRIGLELWQQGDHALPVRGAATGMGSERAGAAGSLVLMRGAIDGTPAFGAYLISAGR